jgi:hypothetical protein
MSSKPMIKRDHDGIRVQEGADSNTLVGYPFSSADSFHVLGSTRFQRERKSLMPEAVLPRLSTDDTTAQLPSDPKELLSPDAQLRRDAETASASLRLA